MKSGDNHHEEKNNGERQDSYAITSKMPAVMLFRCRDDIGEERLAKRIRYARKRVYGCPGEPIMPAVWRRNHEAGWRHHRCIRRGIVIQPAPRRQ